MVARRFMSRFTIELLWPKDVNNTADEYLAHVGSQELMAAKLEAALVALTDPHPRVIGSSRTTAWKSIDTRSTSTRLSPAPLLAASA